MGQIYLVNCKSCGNKWEHQEGYGFIGAYYYCSKCGQEKSINLREDPKIEDTIIDEYGSCACGGTFKMNNETIICPECHSKDTEADRDVIIHWD